MKNDFDEYRRRKAQTREPAEKLKRDLSDLLEKINEDYDDGLYRGPEFLEGLLRSATKHEYTLSREEWVQACKLYAESQVLPSYIKRFLISLAESFTPKAILDLEARGSFIYELVDKIRPSKASAICSEPYQLTILEALYGNSVQWKHRNLANDTLGIDSLDMSFDLIIEIERFFASSWNSDSYFTDRYLNNLGETLAHVSKTRKLSDLGRIICLTKPHILSTSFSDHLAANDLYVDAAFDVLPGAWRPEWNEGAILLCISREKRETLFVAQIPEDSGNQEIVLTNYKSMSPARSAWGQGLLYPREKFVSIAAMVNEHEVQRLAKIQGFPVELLANLADEIITNKVGQLKYSPNSIYLPLDPQRPVLTTIDGTLEDDEIAVQVRLRQDKISATYLASFLNSPIGFKWKLAMSDGRTRAMISARTVPFMLTPVPDLVIQTDILRVEGTIADTAGQLETLRRKLWQQPQSWRTAEKTIRLFRQNDDFEIWLDGLPHPLAATLWDYRAKIEPTEKLSCLFLFFEAMAQFLTTVLVSSLLTDEETRENFLSAYMTDEGRESSTTAKPFRTPSFGNWIYLFVRLAKFTRRMTSDDGKRSLAMKLFGTPEREFLELITSSELAAILEAANGLRIKWKAHHGYISKQQSCNALAELESNLYKFRQMSVCKFDTVTLISPEIAEFKQSRFSYVAKRLMGPNSTFRKCEIASDIPLDIECLYLAHEGQFSPVAMAPFIRFLKFSEQDEPACYFFSRAESADKNRWLSYSTHAQSEIIRSESEAPVSPAICLLYPSD